MRSAPIRRSASEPGRTWHAWAIPPPPVEAGGVVRKVERFSKKTSRLLLSRDRET